MVDKWRDLKDTLYKSQRFRAIVTDAEWDILGNGDEPGRDQVSRELLITIEERYAERFHSEPYYSDQDDETKKIKQPSLKWEDGQNYLERLDNWAIALEEKDRAYTELCASLHRSDITGGYEFGTDAWRVWSEYATPQELHEMTLFDTTYIGNFNHFDRLSPEDKRRAVDIIKAGEASDPYLEWIHGTRMDLRDIRDETSPLLPPVYLKLNEWYWGMTLVEAAALTLAGILTLANPDMWIMNIRYYSEYPKDFVPDAVNLVENIIGGMIMGFFEDPDLATMDILLGFVTAGSGKVGSAARKITHGAKEKAIIEAASIKAKSMVDEVAEKEFRNWGGTKANRDDVMSAVMTSKPVADAMEQAAQYLIAETERAHRIGRRIEDIVGYEQGIVNWINRNWNRGEILDWDQYVAGYKTGLYINLDDITIPQRPSMFTLKGTVYQLQNLYDWVNPEKITFQVEAAKRMARKQEPFSVKGLFKKENPKLSSFDAYLESRGGGVKKTYAQSGFIGVLREWNEWRKTWVTNEYNPDEMPQAWQERWLTSKEANKNSAWGDWNAETADRWLEYEFAGKKRTFLREKGDHTKDRWRPRNLVEGGDDWYSRTVRLNPDTDAYIRQLDANTIELNYFDLDLEQTVKMKFRGANASAKANKWWADYVKENEAGRIKNRYYYTGSDIPDWETFKNFERVEVGKRLYVKQTDRWKYRLGRRRGTHAAIDPKTGKITEVIELTDTPPELQGILFKHRPEIPTLFPVNDDLWTLVSLESLMTWRRYIWISYIGAESYNEVYANDERLDLFGKPILDMDRYSMFAAIYGEHAPYKDNDGNPVNPLETEWGRWTPEGNVWQSEDFLYWIRKDEKYKDVDRDDLWSMKTGFDNGLIARVLKVVDGDTFDVKFSNGKVERIRMLGVDTPETHDPANRTGKAGKFSRTGSMQDGEYLYHWGKEAAMATANLIEGKDVLVVFDANNDTHGGFGRLLAHIYYKDGRGEWKNLAEYLLVRGLARVYPEGENEGQDYYMELMKQAAEEGKGVWLLAETDTEEWDHFIEVMARDMGAEVAAGQLKTTEESFIAARAIR